MKILIDIGHPAHVHLFRNFAGEMISRGHEVLFTCREKEFVIELLNHYDLPYISLGRKPGSLLLKAAGILKFGFRLLQVARRFRPDLFLSHGSYNASHVAFMMGKPHIAFEDTFNNEQVWLYKPFTRAVLTSDYDHPMRGGKIIRYPGYHELAYLHPMRFTPDETILEELGIKKGEKYVIIRFVSWNASHDLRHKGISLENKIAAVGRFAEYARVFISSESELTDELKPYQLKISPFRMHDAIAFASLLFGESATMVAEAAVLGVPGIYLDKTGRYYTRDLENSYGLCYNYSETAADQVKAIDQGVSILKKKDVGKEWTSRRMLMLTDKIDVTGFLVWLMEEWPASMEMVRKNPDSFRDFEIRHLNQSD